VRLDRFDYFLPKEQVAQYPTPRRDEARLLVVDRATGKLYHENFPAIKKYLRPGDALVVNDARVLPARLLGRRTLTGGRWEGLFLAERPDGWEMLCKTRGRIADGETVAVDGSDLQLTLVRRTELGHWILAPSDLAADPMALMQQVGKTPLPPYIRGGVADERDAERYQTVYAERPGSVAAPTAGLHFTPELLAELEAAGVTRERVTLDVGIGTFLPVKTGQIEDHHMHEERCEITADTADRLNQVRAKGGRIVAVGTTTVRTLETAAGPDGRLQPFADSTSIYITPGWKFQAVDALVTNFHLPRSTLLMLVCAFAGYELTMDAYREAVKRDYRFFSYGDAMLIV
jgi:S-adenosylmethionine:tRNA ribosyltransferase-isomerase